MENGHRVGNNNGNRNRTRGMRCKVERDRVRGSGFGTGIGDREHEISEYRNMKHVGERDQGRRYERIHRNDKAGDNGLNRAGPGDPRRLHAGSETRLELGR